MTANEESNLLFVKKISSSHYIITAKKAYEVNVTEATAESIVFKAVISYFSSSAFKKLSIHTQSSRILVIRKFIEYLDSDQTRLNNKNSLLYPDYFNFIKGTRQSLRTNSIWAELHLLNAVFHTYGDKNPDILQFRFRKKKIAKKVDSKPIPSLAELFGNCIYNNFELLNSLRHVCAWIIINQHKCRQELLSCTNIKDTLDNLMTDDANSLLTSPYFSYKSYRSIKSKNVQHKFRILYGEMLAAAASSENELLLERAFVSVLGKKNYFKDEGVLSASEMRKLINCYLTYDSETGYIIFKFVNKRADQWFQSKNRNASAFNNFSAANLLKPTYCEKLAMVYLLASDRVQTSTMQNSLRIDDFSISDGTLSYAIEKGRSKQTIPFSSPVYKRASFIFQAFSKFIDLRLNIDDKEQLLFKSPFVADKIWRFGFGPGVGDDHFFHALADTGSIARKILIEEIGEENASPFLWLLEKQLERRRNYTAYVAQKDKRRYNDQAKLEKPTNVSSSSITVDNIGRSRVLLDDDNDSVFQSKTDSDVSAHLTKHSSDVKETVYLRRSNEKTQIKKHHQIGKIVAGEMLRDAQKLKHMLDKTSIVDIAQASSLLGLKSPADNLDNLIEELPENFEVGALGEILDGTLTVIVQTEVTSALIQSYISKIDDHLEESTELNNEHYELLITKKIYLSEVLKQFTEDLINEGKALSERLKFSYPDLLEALQ